MADFVKGFFGGQKPIQASSGGDDDFADYAGAPEPKPAVPEFKTASSPPAFPTASAPGKVPYTKWYRVWERTTINDFKLELYILPFILVVVFFHLWGTRKNRGRAKHWAKAHAPVLQQEFAQVGYIRPRPSADDVSAVGLVQATQKAIDEATDIDNMMKYKKADEYQTYATGRQNVAFIDFRLTLAKRYNPMMRLGESLIGLVFESLPAPTERMEATAYAFDGQEEKVAPAYGKVEGKKVSNSTYDGFVWGIVHKDLMKRLREDRYDLSLTTTKDHAKLPLWTTVMSENAEITESLLTPELINAIQSAGDSFEALIVSDQPIDQPKTLDETKPRKRLSLSFKLKSTSSSYDDTLPLFQYFLRMPDHLVSIGRFRPEAMRRIRQTREEQIAKIKRVDDEEKAEERKLQADKLKKDQRDAKLSRMSANEQKKYLDKERERDSKKKQKKQTVKA